MENKLRILENAAVMENAAVKYSQECNIAENVIENAGETGKHSRECKKT